MGFKLFCKKTKIEKQYLRDVFSSNERILENVAKAAFIIVPFFFWRLMSLNFSNVGQITDLFAIFKAISLFLVWKSLIKPRRNIFLHRSFLQFWLLIEAMSLESPLHSVYFTTIALLILSYLTFYTWYLNLCFISAHWLIFYCGQFIMEFQKINDLGQSISLAFLIQLTIILLLDMKIRSFWLLYYEEKKKLFLRNDIIEKSNYLFFVLNQQMKFIEISSTAKNLINTNKIAKNTQKEGSFLSFLSEKDHQRFEKQILDSRVLTTSNLPQEYDIRIPTKTLHEIQPEIKLEEEMQNYFQSLAFKNPKFLENTNTINTSAEIRKNEDFVELPFKIVVSTLFYNNMLAYVVSLRNEYKFKEFNLKMKELLVNTHSKSQQILNSLEQDYIKWSNMQSLSIIKESDLKNMALIIHNMNFQMAETFIYLHILALGAPIKKDFNVVHLLTYVLDLIYFKALALNHEISLVVEDSFPDYVSGDFFLFKYVLLIVLNLFVNEWDFPKHSKFKIACKLKEFYSSGNDNHFGLRFEFEYPSNQAFSNYMKTLVFSKEMADPLIFLHSTRIPCGQNLLVFLQKMLNDLKINFSMKDDYEMSPVQGFFLDAAFKTVELSTILSSPSKNSLQNLNSLKSKTKIAIPNINLSFCKTLLRKNQIVWKMKAPVANKPINSALLSSLQRNIEMNDSINRKISIKNKDGGESPSSNRKSIIKGLDVPKTTETKFPLISPKEKIKEKEEDKRNGFEINNNFTWEVNKIPNNIMEEKSSQNSSANTSHQRVKSMEIKQNLAQSPMKPNHKSYFSCFDGNFKIQSARESGEFPMELQEKLTDLAKKNKIIFKNIFKKNLLLLLKHQSELELKGKKQQEIPKRKKKTSGGLTIKIQKEIIDIEHLGESKSATLYKRKQMKKLTSPPKTPLILSKKSDFFRAQKSIIIDSSLEILINSPLMKLHSNIKLPLFLEVRSRKHIRQWKNQTSKEKSSNFINIPSEKVQKSDKFFAMIIDDNINNLKEYQKLSYNRALLIDFSDNFKKALDFFLLTLERGKYYDVFLINVAKDREKEVEEFVQQIRSIETQNKLENVYIFCVISFRTLKLIEPLVQAGVNEIFYRVIDDELLKIIFSKAPRGNLLKIN